jgi:hypothetical protein
MPSVQGGGNNRPPVQYIFQRSRRPFHFSKPTGAEGREKRQKAKCQAVSMPPVEAWCLQIHLLFFFTLCSLCYAFSQEGKGEQVQFNMISM